MHFVNSVILVTIVVVIQCESQAVNNGLCFQLQEMHQLCVRQNGDTSHTQVSQGIAGKAGPRGPPGQPAEVDYDVIKSLMTDMFAERRSEIDAKLRNCESAVSDLKKSLSSNCRRNLEENSSSMGLSTIYPYIKKTEVYCDTETDGGGWIVFQRRMDGSVDFYRNWDDYVNGFGNKTGEFWLGLDVLHKLTSGRSVELRIDFEDWDGNKRFAKYSTFSIGDASSVYKLSVGGYSGDATDSLTSHNDMKFSTHDKDSDTWPKNCAVSFKGAWWYKSCHSSNLNGAYFKGGVHKSYADGIEWASWKGAYYSLKITEMKIRPIE